MTVSYSGIQYIFSTEPYVPFMLMLSSFPKDRVKNAQPASGKVGEEVSADRVKASSTIASGFTSGRPQPAMGHSSDTDTLPSPG